ncbi:hypothetical protein [Euryhalocaulis caribicus]|uniref:hypothetical protein n=1 Tax=Euryhalocaulis caribicus TaxID=1161401 RepID=UPI00126951C8|nr:hypothetical protein [Euryhalocaulis caribicus]
MSAMKNRSDIELRDSGYDIVHQTEKVSEITLNLSSRYIYTSKESSAWNFIAHPDDHRLLRHISDLRLGKYMEYFNSNMRNFPKKLNKGSEPTCYGIKLEFPDRSQFIEAVSDYEDNTK